MSRLVGKNKVVAPNNPKTQDPFTAGWEAAMDYTYHDWGPSPPSDVDAAKVKWLNTCNEGHTIRVPDCPACEEMK